MNNFMGTLLSWLRPPGPPEVLDDIQEDDEEDEEDISSNLGPEPPIAARQPSPVKRSTSRAMVRYQSPDDEMVLEETAGTHGKITDKVIWLAGIVGTPILWFILGTGNAQLFSGFRPIFTDGWTFLAYVSGYVYEAFGIALILAGGRAYGRKNFGLCVVTMLLAVFMALSSFFSQYALLQSELLTHSMSLTDQVLAGLPFGGTSHVFVFLLRASIPNVLEFTIVFLFAERKADAMETLKKKQELQRQQLMVRQGQAAMEHLKKAHEVSMTIMDVTAAEAAQRMSDYHEYGVINQPTKTVYIETPNLSGLGRPVQQPVTPRQAPVAPPVVQRPVTSPRPVAKPVAPPVPPLVAKKPKPADLPPNVTELRPQTTYSNAELQQLLNADEEDATAKQ